MTFHEMLVRLPYKLERAAPPFEGNDIKYPESLARYLIERYSQPGDNVFDPFSGLGTSLFTAEELGRIPYGIEYDEERFSWSAGQLAHWQNIICGDSAFMNDYALPKMDFCLTSPPFMARDHKWNPLGVDNNLDSGYVRYLDKIGAIFTQLRARLKRGRYLAVHLDHVHSRTFTPLVWDIGTVISQIMKPEAEILILWNPVAASTPPPAPYTRILIFKNSAR